MENNKAAWTALIAAYTRGYHAENDFPKIFDDFLANQFLTEEERTSFEQFYLSILQQAVDPETYTSFPDRASALACIMQIIAPMPLTLGRARYTEDILEDSITQGVKQYIILGAGMDTFAFRRKDLVEQLQVFEVDHPTTQAFKRSRLTELGWDIPVQLHFVPVDFTKDGMVTALTHSSFDQQTQAVFSWLGVTYYLPREAVFATLRAIADIAPVGSRVIFDYLDTDAFIREKAAPRVNGFISSAQREGTPLNLGFDPSTLADDLSRVGLRLKEDLTPTDIQLRYFEGRKDKYYACEHAHYVCAVVK